MYEILFYRDQNESKDSRIKLNKIRDYVIQTAQQRLSELKERLKNE
ncbi:TPA: shikimate dehydrogenase [Haemophilus influenzae]